MPSVLVESKPLTVKDIKAMLDIISELLKPLGQYEEFIAELNSLINNHPLVPVSSTGLKNRIINKEKGVRQ